MRTAPLPTRLAGTALLLGALATGSGCAATSPHPAPPPAAPPGAPTSTHQTDPDVQFMRHMIHHHAQALEMVALVPGRTANDEVRRLARRIELSQEEEIALMRRWLAARGEEPQGAHSHHVAGEILASGMLTAEELARLAAASGRSFDELLLEFMIRHHEGALIMIEELRAAGGGMKAEIFRFVSHVDADQRAEIARMRRMLEEINPRG